MKAYFATEKYVSKRFRHFLGSTFQNYMFSRKFTNIEGFFFFGLKYIMYFDIYTVFRDPFDPFLGVKFYIEEKLLHWRLIRALKTNQMVSDMCSNKICEL